MSPTSITSARSGAANPRSGLRFGVHTPLQHASTAALQHLWQHAESATVDGVTPAYDWISVWDHLAALDGSTDNLEAVAAHAALAATTSRVQCACLVYSVGLRSPLHLASAIATIDHLGDGRAVLGLGAGYLELDHRMRGEDVPPPAERAQHLVEAAHAIRALLDGEEVTVDGRHVRLDRARCAPVPQQAHLPIVIGGGGEQVTIPLAARMADGWNIPMAAPDVAAHKIALLRGHEARAGRPAGSVAATVNIGVCFDASQLPYRFGPRWEALRAAVCTGSTDEAVDLVGRYRAAGVDRLMLSLRAPYDQACLDDLDRFTAEVLPQVTERTA